MGDISVKIVSDKNLSEKEMHLMNKWRVIEFGRDEFKNFKKDYFPSAKFFFLCDGKEIVAFGTLRNILIDYLNKKYKILGICNIISIKKGKGYGQILISNMINFLKKTGKTGLGFTGKTEFFRKAGLDIKKDFIKRFIYLNPMTKEEIIDNDGDGIYLNGKDNFIRKVLSNKSKVYLNIPHW